MSDTIPDGPEFPAEPPDIDVVDRLVQLCDDILWLESPMDGWATSEVEDVGEWVVESRQSGLIGAKASTHHEAFSRLIEEPWYRHGLEVSLLRRMIVRSGTALDRLLDLRPVVARYPIPDSARRYAAEVAKTYLYGFDSACIAFCGAAIEQVLADALVRAGEYSEPRLRRERPSLLTLVQKAKRRGLLSESSDAAEAVGRHRNHVMHRAPLEPRVVRNVAKECIERFAEVVLELESSAYGTA